MGATRIVLADDHDIVRSGLRALLDASDEIEVVGEARDGEEAIACVQVLRPDVVVMDISMPRMDGEEATRRLSRDHPHVRVVVLSAHDDSEHRHRLREAGAAAYVVKRSATEELVRVIRLVARGEAVEDPYSGEAAAREVRAPRPGSEPSGEALSAGEEAVLRGLAAGQTLGQIAAALRIGADAVQANRAGIREKLGLRSRVDMVRFAQEQNWIADG